MMIDTKSHEHDPLTINQASTLREKLSHAMEVHTKATLSLCALLFESYFGTVKIGANETSLAIAWGFESWEDYVEHELGIHMGTAMSYVRVYDELSVRRNFPAGALPNSITKLRVLALMSRKKGVDINEWAAKSKTLSCCEMQEAYDSMIGGKGRKRNCSFSMKWNAIRPLLNQVKVAKQTFGVGTNGEALSLIVDQWAELHTKSQIRTKKAS